VIQNYLVSPITENITIKCHSCYLHGENICCDESVNLCKGRLSFKQYSLKAYNFGIKTCKLHVCKYEKGYLGNFIFTQDLEFKSEQQSVMLADDSLKSLKFVFEHGQF
jgi:hypothetical protein